MVCIRCGSADEHGNAYCRRCGEWMGAYPGAGARGAGRPEDQLKLMAIFNGMSAAFALFSAIALYATYLGTAEAKWSIYVAGAFSVIITVHQSIACSFAIQQLMRLRRGRTESRRDDASEQKAIGGVRLSERIDVGSVTEGTTELLVDARRAGASRTTNEL